MDDLDVKIISQLLDDSRQPFSRIAKRIGVSTQTVIKRYNELKEKGAIKKASAMVDIRKLGYEGVATLLITCSPGSNLPETIGQLKKTENVIVATEGIGDFEGYAMLAYKNVADLYERIHQIKRVPNIDNIDVSLTKKTFPAFPPNIKWVLFQQPVQNGKK